MSGTSKLLMMMKINLLLICYWTHLVAGQISLNILPNVRDEAKFQGQEFTRLCSVQGTTGDVFYEWLHNGVSIHSGSGLNLELTLPSVDLFNEGAYSCRATLADSSVIGPASAGELIVLDRGMIHAPPEQYVRHGAPSSQLNCSYPGAIAIWYRDGQEVSSQLTSPSFGDEGLYTCELFFIDGVRQVQARTQEYIRLHIFVPVEIHTRPPPFEKLQGNPAHTFRIDFSGREAQNMSIDWYKDDVPIPNNRIVTTYSPSQLSGVTELRLSNAERSDCGVYRVVLRSIVGYGVFSTDETDKETSFQFCVEVFPATPIDFRVENVFSNVGLFVWTLTNQNEDEGADTLTIQLTYDNGTFFRNETFTGSDSQRRVHNLIPGINYTALLVAKNVDGTTTVGPIPVQTLVGNPLVTNLTVQRRNNTYFTATVSLAYTGGGIITRLNVFVHSFISDQENEFTIPAIASPTFGLVWTGDISVTDPIYMPEQQLEFRIAAENQFGYTSTELPAIVPAMNSVTTTATVDPSPVLPDLPIPLWLIIVVVALVATLVTIIALTVCLITICYCKRKHKTTKYNISAPQDLSAAEKQLGEDNAMVTRTDSSDKNLANSMRNGSVPSIQTSTPSNNPQDVRYVDQKIFSHKRNISDASSKTSSNRGHQPSTASNSPAMLKIKYENENNTGESNISLKNVSEYINKEELNESEYQCSQTESENEPRQHFASSGSMYNTTSNLELTNSTCSSVQSSHQSLPNYHPAPRYGSQLGLPAHLHHNSQRNHNHYHHQKTPSISSSVLGGRATSESVCTCGSITTGGESTPEFMVPCHDSVYPTELVSDV